MPVPPAGLAHPSQRPGFLAGAGALFSGFGFLVRTPAVWPLAIVPVTVASIVAGLLAGGALGAVIPAVARLFGPRWGFLATIVDIVVGAMVLLVAALIGLGVAQPLSGPALNRIVRRAEAELGAPAWPATGLGEDVRRALQSIAVSYAVGLPLLATLSVITLLLPAAAPVTLPLKLLILGLTVAWDLCDYPLSIHGVPVAARVAFVSRNARAMVGFGFTLGLLSLVPGAMLLALPAGVAGAARLTRQIELFEAGGRR